MFVVLVFRDYLMEMKVMILDNGKRILDKR